MGKEDWSSDKETTNTSAVKNCRILNADMDCLAMLKPWCSNKNRQDCGDLTLLLCILLLPLLETEKGIEASKHRSSEVAAILEANFMKSS